MADQAGDHLWHPWSVDFDLSVSDLLDPDHVVQNGTGRDAGEHDPLGGF